VRPQAEVRHTIRDDPGLVDRAGPHLQPRANTKVVILAATRTHAQQLHFHSHVRVAAVVAKHANADRIADEDILITVSVDVSDGDRRGAPRR
jgi:hypothetical protein